MRQLLLLVLSGLLLAGCANQTPTTTAGLGNRVPLGPGKYPGTLVYKAPDLDIALYHGILIDQATIYTGPDADYGNVSWADKQQLAANLTSEYTRVLSEKFNVVSQPGPGIARLHLALAGVTESRSGLSTLLRLTPVGLGITGIKSVADEPAAFTGTVTIAGQVTDTQTGDVLAGFVSRESPQAYDLTSGLGSLRAAQLGITRGAEEFSQAVQALQKQQAAAATPAPTSTPAN
jgi:hypothetical protein